MDPLGGLGRSQESRQPFPMKPSLVVLCQPGAGSGRRIPELGAKRLKVEPCKSKSPGLGFRVLGFRV